jgi:membrane protein YqaA with SNARE-associated domain
MTSGLIVLVASALVVSGVVIGWWLSQWRLEARARRQAAAQLSLYRQLHELQAQRQRTAEKREDLAVEFRRRAA